MQLEIYVLRDVRTEAYLKPMFLQNRAVLERAVLDAKQDGESLLAKHPEDYQVFHLGVYDDSNGEIAAVPPTHLFNVLDLEGK